MVLFGTSSPHVSSSFLERSTHSSCLSEIEASPRINSTPVKNQTANEEPRHPICSFVVIYTMIFFNGCCFTAVAPSVPFYLQFLEAPPKFLGWVVSAYSLGQIVGSPLAGWFSNVLSSKCLLIISSTMGLFSSAVYAVAPGYVFIFFSRLLTGISAGWEFTTELTYIANNTTVRERTAYLASVTACNIFGFIMGPAMAAVVAVMDLHVLELTIDQYTGPGWLLAAMFLLDLIMLQLLFKDYAFVLEYDSAINGAIVPSERTSLLLKNKDQRDASYGGVSMERMEANPQESANGFLARGDPPHQATDSSTAKEPPPSIFLVVSLIFVQFSLMGGFSLLETITAPLAQDEFGWTVRDCNILFAWSGFFALIVYVTFVVASKQVQDRRLVFTALVLCSTGFFLAVDWSQLDWMPRWLISSASAIPLVPPYLARFLVGFAFIFAGFITGRSITFALYSKLIAQQYQGKYLGWMVAGGSAARTLGPFFAVYLYYGVKGAGNNLLALFGSGDAFHLACLVLLLCQWPQLLPRNPAELPSSTTNEH